MLLKIEKAVSALKKKEAFSVSYKDVNSYANYEYYKPNLFFFNLLFLSSNNLFLLFNSLIPCNKIGTNLSYFNVK